MAPVRSPPVPLHRHCHRARPRHLRRLDRHRISLRLPRRDFHPRPLCPRFPRSRNHPLPPSRTRGGKGEGASQQPSVPASRSSGSFHPAQWTLMPALAVCSALAAKSFPATLLRRRLRLRLRSPRCNGTIVPCTSRESSASFAALEARIEESAPEADQPRW